MQTGTRTPLPNGEKDAFYMMARWRAKAGTNPGTAFRHKSRSSREDTAQMAPVHLEYHRYSAPLPATNAIQHSHGQAQVHSWQRVRVIGLSEDKPVE